MDKLRILFLADYNNVGHAGTVFDHINGIRHLSRHHVTLMNPRFGASMVGVDLSFFDVILIHYSIWILWETYLSAPLRQKIRRSPCLKAQFIQDEYRYVNMTVDRMVDLGIDVLFSCVPEETLSRIYGDSRLQRVRKVPVLTGYVPEGFIDGLSLPPIIKRPIDIGYRSRANAPWLGNLSREKVLIAEGILQRAPALELKCDVSVQESDRIYGKDWPIFLGRCRAVLGTASGASIVDFDGKVESAANEYLMANPWASYDEVFDKVLAPYEGKAVINTISPRIFEAAVTRTAQIMFESPYAGIIDPWVHYIPLKRDFSNMAEVAALVRDDSYLEDLTERAHSDLVESGRFAYAQLTQLVDNVLGDEVARQRTNARKVAPSISSGSSNHRPFQMASLFYARIYPFLISGLPYIRMVKLMLFSLFDAWVLIFIVALLTKHKGRTQQLRAAIAELGRIAILRGKRIRGRQSERALSVTTVLQNGVICFHAAHRTEKRPLKMDAEGKMLKRIAAAFAEGRIKRILWQAKLPIEDRPEFFEGASPINSIYEFENLTHLGKEFPALVARLVCVNPFSNDTNDTGKKSENSPT